MNALVLRHPEVALREAGRDAVRALALDDKEAYLRSALGLVEVLLGNTERGIQKAQAAVRLNPNDVAQTTFLGAALGFASRVDDALARFDMAENLSPGYPPISLFKGDAYYEGGRVEKAIPRYEQLLMALPEYNWA